MNQRADGNSHECSTIDPTFMHATFEAISDLVVITDKDATVVQANRAAREAFEDKDVIGAHCWSKTTTRTSSFSLATQST